MNTMETQRSKKQGIYFLTRSALMAAVICILGPLSIPNGPVPISLTNFAIYLTVYLIGWKMGAVSVAVYLLIGMTGIPVFSGFSGGMGKLLGPTGGYLVGFLPLAVIAGLVIGEKRKPVPVFLGYALGTAVLYLLGTGWYCYVSGNPWNIGMKLCVIPFIPLDLIKIVITMLIGPVIRKKLCKAGLFRD